MIGATVYLFFGMALMSMSFNLIQEEIVIKFAWLAEKLGVGEKATDAGAEEEMDPKTAPRPPIRPPPQLAPRPGVAPSLKAVDRSRAPPVNVFQPPMKATSAYSAGSFYANELSAKKGPAVYRP